MASDRSKWKKTAAAGAGCPVSVEIKGFGYPATTVENQQDPSWSTAIQVVDMDRTFYGGGGGAEQTGTIAQSVQLVSKAEISTRGFNAIVKHVGDTTFILISINLITLYIRYIVTFS